MPTLTAIHDVTIDIGAIPILVRTDSADFAHLLEDRYGEFITADPSHAVMELEIRLVREPGDGRRDGIAGTRDTGHGRRDSDSELQTPDPGLVTPESGINDDPDAEVSVRLESGRWVMTRGDFRAEWDPQCHRGWVRQTLNPYSIDGVLRILHSLILARAGGFLVHGASAVRNGRAFVFAGVSGTGKTTIARLAPPDVTLLTDEISYLRPGEQGTGTGGWGLGAEEQGSGAGGQVPGAEDQVSGARGQKESQISNHQSQIANHQSQTPYPVSRTPAFSAFGTPFAGELARIGQKVRAPLAGLFLLEQGPKNRIEPVSEAQAVRELMRHVLFFAHDEELVGMIFQTVFDFVRRVPVRRLVFTRDASVWELIG